MSPHEASLKRLITEGIITDEEAARLCSEAESQNCRPLDLLEERGIISPQTRADFEESNLDPETINPYTEAVGEDEETVNPLPIIDERTINPDAGAEDSLGEASTIPPNQAPSPEISWKDHPDAPVKNWQRYQLLRPLGSGGMSQVFLARDHQLKRTVALKFLHYQHPSQVSRFFQEAQAQARVDHEHVCKIYEVGKVDDQPFIAMQHIPGESLDKVAENLSLEKKLLLAKQIAWGLQAAHSAGLIHRDIKPGNIMVANQNNLLRPFILDFGLARMEEAPSLTADGSLLGTPAYMPPEQARGELQSLDRRSDVYSLGGTIYHMLVGRPPLGSANWAELLRRILEEEVRFPAESKIPRDIRTIVLKCLDKDPEQRYPSARALAEDLERYLQGEPIQATPPGLVYRVGKKLRKHKWISAALVLLLMSLFWGTHTQWQASRREALVRELASETSAIEAASLRAYMAPAHDIGPDFTDLRERMAQMGAVIAEQGALAAGPGHYALGVGYLALDDLQMAHKHLEQAWVAGNDGSATAYALSLALANLYREALSELQHLPDPGSREAQREALAAHYGPQLEQFVVIATTYEASVPNYLEALLAYTESNYVEALRLLDQEQAEPAWFFEGNRLRGDIYRDWAGQHYDQNNFEEARSFSIRAREFYALAADTARSHPGILLAKANTWLQQMTGDRHSSTNIALWYEKADDQLKEALILSPADPVILLNRSRLNVSMATYLGAKEQDPTTYLNQALQQLDLIQEVDQETPMIRARIFAGQAQWYLKQRRETHKQTQEAMNALGQIDSNNQDHAFYQLRAQIYRLVSSQARIDRTDPCESLEKAINDYRTSIQHRPELVHGHHNLLNTLLQKARLSECLRETSPLSVLQEAKDVVDAILKQHPDHPFVKRQAGRVYFALAQRGDPQLGYLNLEQCDQAIAFYHEALKQNGDHIQVYNDLANVYLTRQRHAWESGESTQDDFKKAIGYYQTCIQKSPNSRRFKQNIAWAYYYHYKYSLQNAFSAQNDDEQALKWSKEADALSQKPTMSSLICQLSIWRKRLERNLRKGHNDTKVTEGFATLAMEVKGRNPDHVEYHRSLAALYIVRVQADLAKGKSASWGHLKAARMLLEESVYLPKTPYVQLVRLRLEFFEYLYFHKIGSPRIVSARSKSQDLIAELAQARPGLQEVHFFKAALEGRKQLDTFLKEHPHYKQTWGSVLSHLPN